MLYSVSQTVAVVVGALMVGLVVNGSFLEDLIRNGDTSTANFSRSRRSSAVLLNRRKNAIEPEGLYRCDVIDARNITQTLHIGINQSKFITRVWI